MFARNYIFETEKTKLHRSVANFFLLTFLFLISFTVFCLYILNFANEESSKAEEAFFQKSPHLVVIFTGDTGRIEFGIKKAMDFESDKIFITGVGARNSLYTLLKMQFPTFQAKSYPLARKFNVFEIDYSARNTIENVLSTLAYLRKGREYKKILIVSSDYHLLRIKMIVENLKPSEGHLDFYYVGKESDFSQWRSFRILFKEVIKNFKSFALFFFWDTLPTRSE